MNQRTAVFRGNFRHAHCSEVHWAATLEALGWTVHRLQEDETGVRQIVRALHLHRPELLVSTRTWPWPALTMAEWASVAETADQVGTTTVAVHLDRLWGLARQHLVHDDPFFRAEFVFTADGAHDPEFAAAGVNHHWWPPGVFHEDCYVGRIDPQWESYDVGFVGSLNYHDEHPHRTEMVAFCQARYGRRFVRIGDGTPTLRGDDLNRFYATVPVIVGDSLCLHRGSDRYWSDRIPETLGRGGTLLHPRVNAAVELYGTAVYWWEWGDFDGLAALIESLLGHRAGLAAGKQAGSERARGQWSYLHRWVDLLDTVGCGYDASALAVPVAPSL